ncbi:MAG: hypothetical protein K8R69_10345 [Deltaproteobacteria bacterium]|nr:hypothetical protein [Deltaproteobacteria bacterium]
MKLDSSRLRDLVSDPAASAELEAIFQENQAPLLLRELGGFARRQAEAGRVEAAAGIDAWIARLPPETGINAGSIAAIAAEARADLDALRGQGPFGRRMEFLTRRFSRDATDYRTILPMMLGGLAGTYAGTLVLGRFSAGVQVGFGGALRARAWAGAAALAVEVPIYSLSSRALSAWSGTPQAWDSPSLAGDFFSCLLNLGAMKLGGALGEEGRALSRGFGTVGSTLPMLTQFSALLVTHRLEAALGLRPKADLAAEMTDGLATLLSLEAGARVGRRILGPGFRALQARLQFRNKLYRQRPFSRLPLSGSYFPPKKGDSSLVLVLPLLGMMGTSWREPKAALAVGAACFGMALWDRILRPRNGDGRLDDPIHLGPERNRGLSHGRREPMSLLQMEESDLRLGNEIPFIKKTVLEDYCLLGNCTVGKIGGYWWIFREFESPFFGRLTFLPGSRPEVVAKVGNLYPLDSQDQFLMDAMSYVWDRERSADAEPRQSLDVRTLNRHILLGDLRGIRQAGVYYRDDFARNLSIHYQAIQVNPYPVHPTWNALIDPRNGLIAALGSGAASGMEGMVRVKMHFDRLTPEPTYQPRIRRLEFFEGWQPEEPLRGQLEGLIGLEVRPLLLHPMVVLDARRNGLPEIPLPAQAPLR